MTSSSSIPLDDMSRPLRPRAAENPSAMPSLLLRASASDAAKVSHELAIAWDAAFENAEAARTVSGAETNRGREEGDTVGRVEGDDEIEQASLPRADGGKAAWLFLAGCFTIEALVWGFPFSYGVFQDYYTNLPLFAAHSSGIAIIGTCASGIMYLSAPFTFYLLNSHPLFRRFASLVGLIIITFALIISSFSMQIWHLIITQGVLYAIGGSLLYLPAILYLDEWFIKRKGLAYGVMWAGTGVSGIIVPFVMSWGLDKYGFRTMLRSWALVLVILATPLIYYVQPRIPHSTSRNSVPRQQSWKFLLTPTFLLLEAGNITQSLGFFIPTIYLPLYARSLHLPPSSGSLALALFNCASVVGQVAFGILSDRLHVTTVILISTLGATVSVFLLWGLTTHVPLLLIFSLMYGVFAGGFSSTYSGIIKAVQRESPGSETGSVFGLLAAGRGIGAVASGPISEALLGAAKTTGGWRGAAGYGSSYGSLIVFTGITAACGGLSFVGRKAKLM